MSNWPSRSAFGPAVAYPAMGCMVVACLLSTSAGLAATRGDESVRRLVDDYLADWQSFHPSRTLSMGMGAAVWSVEDRSREAIERWIARNESTTVEVRRWLEDEATAPPDRVDLRLLRAQIRRELATWRDDEVQLTSLQVFAQPIANALAGVLGSPQLTPGEKSRLLVDRVRSVEQLALAARGQWRGERRGEAEAGLERLREALASLGSERSAAWPAAETTAETGFGDELGSARRSAVTALERLIAHVEQRLPSLSADSPILGREAYARGLALYLDGPMTPEEMAELAAAQMEDAKEDIRSLSADYWRAMYPREPLPNDPQKVVQRAFEDLEARRPANNAEYLSELRAYGREIEAFVRQQGIATIPEQHTLSIEIAPESAGPMARVGYVSSAPPFAPNPWTTWYLATIPDDFPEQERIDFWRSFNYPFKKFIVVHELFPGHYLQQKLLRENLHPVRIFFGWSPFTEGWATFCEEVAFEHGWAAGDHLVRLAQQRKRLENANRAFMSVQAHVNGWSEERVYQTSIESSWLAPQFAKSLWNRLINWPFQMTTYMLGGLQLQELYRSEQTRLGAEFSTRDFMDTVLRLGPIPVDEIGPLLGQQEPAP